MRPKDGDLRRNPVLAIGYGTIRHAGRDPRTRAAPVMTEAPSLFPFRGVVILPISARS